MGILEQVFLGAAIAILLTLGILTYIFREDNQDDD